ncbi:zonular occludens toxin domain-containing protein [Acinetobacter schindleri]|uniref:zonular occludens toxin domain-containing protein n=1 Tax=Acinetobacter schindleri TaxID=108981 RepID=UPI002730864F|nr:zonular occludens toxin domain-containing protein [Acinetobacter schindleri]MDP1444522.1 zonular occludens toxin domain-containing protein [Acinetobacter schindleri]MDP1444532.1 zonular occludens toxin domain-containing protein [Acinetobacter schindleri]
MLFLITGKPGSFKTAKCASLAIDYLKAGRRVFTNIDEFNYEGVEKLPDNDDWTNTPIGSVVIYDEAQQFDFLQYKGREKLSSDHRVKELEVHRHTGHDIILITQSPSFLHNHVLSLVGMHYHLHRAYGRSYADVFLWRYTAHSPDSTGAKNKAESHTKFKPDAKIFDKYKSTEVDTHKLKIPPLYFKLGGFLACVLLLIGYMVFGSDNPFLSASKIKENADIASGKRQAEQPLVGSQAASASISSPAAALDLSLECRKAVNIEKSECIKWFDDLTKNGSSVSPSGQVVQTVSYNPNKPYDFEYQPQVQPTDFPRMSGVIKLSNGRLMAVDQQGNYMPEISARDCQKWLDGYRPFNYFAQSQNQQSQRSVGEQPQLNPETSSL